MGVSPAATEDEIKKLVLAGLHAPTGTNRREIRFSVVKGDMPELKELNKDLRGGVVEEGKPDFYYSAPVLFILSAEDNFKWSALDAGIAVQNMALEAEELGLGSLIIGCIKDVMSGEKKEYYNNAFKIPEGYTFEIALAVGHKAVTKEPHTFDEAAQVVYL